MSPLSAKFTFCGRSPVSSATIRALRVVTTLNARIVAEETGDLPQNVNFALKGDIARSFLDELAVPYRTSASTVRLGNADVGDIGRRFTVMVECYR